MYLIRLDDASEYWDRKKWCRMAELLDRYDIKPIFGVIPDNQDPKLLEYGKDPDFLGTISEWIAKGYTPALHSDTHVYCTDCAGMNPVNRRSEFAGLSLEMQREKIRKANGILLEHGIHADIFFALAHTFDENTLKALEAETNIRVISDTPATDIYYKDGFYFIPQQTGGVRKLPFRTVTFCYHPNTMSEHAFADLEQFLEKYHNKFTSYPQLELKKRKLGFWDRMVKVAYFGMRKLRR